MENFDVIVIGAGHAGVEAALACSRMGQKTLCLCLNLDSVALCACNPAIGGTSKGHLVREIDALGGEMGLAADETLIQARMLNLGKGPAVHSPRAQIDKRMYHERIKSVLEKQENLFLRQDECVEIKTCNQKVCGIRCAGGMDYECSAVIICTGVYLKSKIHVGESSRNEGPSGLVSANMLSESLKNLGFELRRFKTGTPPRLSGKSIDYSKLELQCGDTPMQPFSFLTDAIYRTQRDCYLTYTNARTHEIILQNLYRSPMYSGKINAAPTRYCPSIEDKLVRFSDKERHQLFIEPEGNSTYEMYVQGFSTSLPKDVQRDALRTINGLENCEITRYGYAIEYDCIDPTELNLTLGSKRIAGLYFAGQLNGSSGYEEAAAQGLIAGINAALYVKGEAPFILRRSEAYIGVLIDDLVTKGTNEPYRMMTSRAEYRLALRHGNADLRLTELGRRTGLISEERLNRLNSKTQTIAALNSALEKRVKPDERLNEKCKAKGETPPRTSIQLSELLKRSNINYKDVYELYSEMLCIPPCPAADEVETEIKYAGYIEKQAEQIRRFEEHESMVLPQDMDYNIEGLRIEARQKLNALRPANIGQASRISGVSPADISVLMIVLKAMNRDSDKEINE